MKWPDMIQIIGKQYGVIYTDDEVAFCPLKKKFNWLRRNPVTVARHFQNRLNTFFQNPLQNL